MRFQAKTRSPRRRDRRCRVADRDRSDAHATAAPGAPRRPERRHPRAVPAGPAPQGGRGQAGGGRGSDPFEGADLSPKDPVTAVSPAEEQKRFLLPPGYRIEPVLTEPDIEEPMQIAFDGNGRMFVLEIRGYMQDADATGELAPTGRISVHEDADNDGVYEKHSVFVDKLVFPRFVMPFGANAILTMESNQTRCGSTPTPTATRSPTRRSCSRPASAAPATSSTSRAACCGAWTTGCTAPTTPSASAGRRAASSGSRRRQQRAVGHHAGQRRQGLVPGRRQRAARLLPAADPLRR